MYEVVKLSNNLRLYILKELLNLSVPSWSTEKVEDYRRTHVNDALRHYSKKLFEIDGSSFKGQTNEKNIIGSWWNHEIINKETQISAVSGRILPQKVKFLGKKELILFDKKYKALKFHFLSNDNKPTNKKKINFNVWYDEKTLLWLKMSYEKMGKWEYRLKKHTFY